MEETILATAFRLIAERGLDRVRVQDVADEAGVGLASVYRRWDTKSDLVLAAVNAHLGGVGIFADHEMHGDPRQDLVQLLERLVRLIEDEHGELIPGFVATLRSDSGTAAELRTALLEPLRARVRRSIERCLGDDVPDVALRADLALGAIIFRHTIMGEPLTPSNVRRRLVPILLGEQS
jgi:AcrR family transcriptional regulator